METATQNLDLLIKLKALTDEGILTQEEFDDKKTEIMHPDETAHKNALYTQAVSCALKSTSEGYAQAISLFHEIPGWKNADELCAQCELSTEKLQNAKVQKDDAQKDMLRQIKAWCRSSWKAILPLLLVLILLPSVLVPALTRTKIGDVTVGNRIFYGKTLKGDALEWEVLAVDGNRVLVRTIDPIGEFAYHDSYNKKGISWKKSDLRSMLNDDFYKNDFSSAEKNKIKKASLSSTSGKGKEKTKDKLFVLNDSECKQYNVGQKGWTRGFKSAGSSAYYTDYMDDKEVFAAMWLQKD